MNSFSNFVCFLVYVLFITSKIVPSYSCCNFFSEQLIITPTDAQINFTIPKFLKKCLLEGLDDISLTLNHENLITQYEQNHNDIAPSE